MSFSFEILSTTYAKTLRGTRNANLELRAILRKAILVLKPLRNLAPVYLRQMICSFSANYDPRNLAQ